MTKLTSAIIGFALRHEFGPPAFTILKSEAAKGYVHLVKNVKAAVLVLYLFLILTVTAVIGTLLFIFGLASVLGATTKNLEVLALVVGGILFLISAAVTVVMCSEKVWMKAAKIEEIVSRVVEENDANTRGAFGPGRLQDLPQT